MVQGAFLLMLPRPCRGDDLLFLLGLLVGRLYCIQACLLYRLCDEFTAKARGGVHCMRLPDPLFPGRQASRFRGGGKADLEAHLR